MMCKLFGLVTQSSSSSQSRINPLVGGRIKNKKRITNQAPQKAVRVLNEDGKDVTPLRLSPAEPRDESQPGRYFLDTIFTSSGSAPLRAASSSNVHSSYSSYMDSGQRYTVISQTTGGSENSVFQPVNHQATSEVLRKRDNMKEDVTEEMLDVFLNICLSDTISLLDTPSTILFEEEEDDAEGVKERNVQYAELCKNRVGNDKYTARSAQTLNGTPKSKPTQTYKTAVLDEGTVASPCDIYDSMNNQNQTLESGEKAEYPVTTENTSKGQEKRERSSSRTTVRTGTTMSSQLEEDISLHCEDSVKADYDLQLVLSSESFKCSLVVMERSVVANTFQTKLAAYKQLPILKDPDSTVEPGAEEQKEEGEEGSSSPMLEYLLDFSCELTRGSNVTSMAWNKKNPDMLAVGYGDYDSRNQKQSLICCWCFKNPTWPERIIHCHSCVISLDFSANNPNQLAVGMDDGTMAIYNVSQSNGTYFKFTSVS
ncbi:WD repeat-containing protein 78 [Liparis tanakae]|uniref:Dynein axonemal intermediate chain 4 n=1 Tax=Liparis tanakae TaxID=230148 RepID=A0A4Z2IQR3_9TELE|nr:WD repeat-containing protein 78 [Liparis tanakae]